MTPGAGDPDERREAAFDRFRRADPARDAETDLAALRARVAERLAQDPSSTPAPDTVGPSSGSSQQGDDVGPSPGSSQQGDDVGPSPGSSQQGDDDAALTAGGRTGRRGWVVAAAVATMLAVGTGGYLAGSYTQAPTSSESAEVASQWAPTSDQSGREGTEQERAAQDDAATGAEGPVATEDAEVAPEVDPGAAPVQFVDGGLPTETREGEAWIVTDDADADPVMLGEYPTISAAEAVARLSDPRFTSHPWHQPSPPGPQDRADPPAIPPAPGAPLPWPVHEVRLVAAELSVGGYTYDGGDTWWMLPTWILTDEQGQTWSVLAVTEDALAIE